MSMTKDLLYVQAIELVDSAEVCGSLEAILGMDQFHPAMRWLASGNHIVNMNCINSMTLLAGFAQNLASTVLSPWTRHTWSRT